MTYQVSIISIVTTNSISKRLKFTFYVRRGGFYKWEDHHPSHVAPYGGTSGGRAICISACDDHQNSADTSVSMLI